MLSVVITRLKYSIAAAGMPDTSIAICSSARTVPLRRRYPIVLATSARLPVDTPVMS